MTEIKNSFLSCVCESQSHSQSQVGYSFREVLAYVRDQIEIECYTEQDKPQAKEIALIIAEVYKLPAACEIQIAGNKLPAEMVQEIFARLSNDNVTEVIRHYKEARYEIKHTKTYIRTALYNSVFEFESRLDNEVRSDFPYLG